MDREDPIGSLYGDLAKAKTLMDVLNLSIAFDKPVKTQMHYGDSVYYETLGNYKPEKEKKYGQHGGVFSFFYNGVRYEVHVTDQIEKILRENGFTFDPSLGSILSGGVVPTDFQEFWHMQEMDSFYIKQNIELGKRTDAIEAAIEASECTPISEELILNRCFRIPTCGYRYLDERIPDRIKLHKPFKEEENSELTRQKMAKSVGKMSRHVYGGGYSAQRTFVYLDGNVYVTESQEVISELIRHGFVESDDVANLGIGWYERILDPFYADKYGRVMISDEEYSKKETKDYKQREVEYIEKKNKDLQTVNDKMISSIAYSYYKYRETTQNNGGEVLPLKDFILTVLGLELPDEIVDEIQKHVK